jgi:hypothetical protein
MIDLATPPDGHSSTGIYSMIQFSLQALHGCIIGQGALREARFARRAAR